MADGTLGEVTARVLVPARDFAVTAVAYGLAAFASLAFRMPGTNVSLVWLAAGVAAAAMWLRGIWLWTAVATAAAVGSALEGNLPFNVVRVALANTAAPVVVVLLLRRMRFDPALARFRDAVAMLAASACGGLVGTVVNGVLRLAERGVQGDELSRVLNWWLGDVTGLLVLAPVAFTWAARGPVRARPRHGEAVAVALLLAAVAALAWMAFPRGAAALVSVLYLAVPVQMWAAARLGPRDGAQALAIVAGGVLLASITTLQAHVADPHSALVLLDGFLIVSGSASLVVAALVAEKETGAAALAEARRLESVRRLAGGLAHDFHNLLTVILGHVDLLGLDQSRRDVEDDLDAIRRAAARAASITQQLLAYGQQMLLRPTRFDVNELVAEVDSALPGLAGPGVAHRLSLAEALPPVHTDRDQLGRVLSQLCIRASAAMPKGGTITIATREERIARGPLRAAAVAIRVEDTGSPAASAADGQLLEPYSGPLPTGDPARRSSGLELAMADGFARQVGGTVTVESPGGRGTAVTLTLPAAPPPDA